MKTMCAAACLGLLAFCLAGAGFADEIVTRSGTHIKGQVTSGGDRVTIKTEDGTLTLPASRVTRVVHMAVPVDFSGRPQASRTRAIQANGGGVGLKGQAGSAALQAALERHIAVRFDETPLVDVLSYLQEIAGINFVYNAAEVQSANVLVTLHLENVTVRQVLDLAVGGSTLGWTVASGNVIRLGPHESIERYIVRTYDVRDLLQNVEDKQARRTLTLTETGTQETQNDSSNAQFGSDSGGLGFNSTDSTSGNGQGLGGTASESLPQRAFSLATLITSTVRPETWAQPAVVQCGGVAATDEQNQQTENTPW